MATTRQKSSRTVVRRRILLQQHRERWIEASEISDRVAEERGYRSLTANVVKRGLDLEALYGHSAKSMAFYGSQLRPGLLIPTWNVYGEIAGFQLRPEKPRLDRQSGRERSTRTFPGCTAPSTCIRRTSGSSGTSRSPCTSPKGSGKLTRSRPLVR
jgi:hypothetical protein